MVSCFSSLPTSLLVSLPSGVCACPACRACRGPLASVRSKLCLRISRRLIQNPSRLYEVRAMHTSEPVQFRCIRPVRCILQNPSRSVVYIGVTAPTGSAPWPLAPLHCPRSSSVSFSCDRRCRAAGPTTRKDVWQSLVAPVLEACWPLSARSCA